MSDDFRLFAPLQKIDDELRQVFGYASTESRDQQGEVITRGAISNALPAYLKFPTVREMHQPSAVGTGIEAEATDKGLWFGCKVVDDGAWKKVKAGVYRGFSVGGRITKRDPNDRNTVLGIDLHEISLVDRPANPDASFTLVKRADGLPRLQPVQVWSCGNPAHAHLAKSEAMVCMEATALHSQDTMAKGGFTSAQDINDEAMQQFRYHEKLAAEARDSAALHRKHQDRARKSADGTAREMHAQLADLGDILASHNERVAGHYYAVAEKFAGQSGAEDVMNYAGNELQKIVDAADDAMDQLTKAAAGSELTKAGGAHETMVEGQNADALAIESIVAATQLHAKADEARANGQGDPAKHEEAKARQKESVAEQKAELAARLHEMVSTAINPKTERGAAQSETPDTDLAQHHEKLATAKQFRKYQVAYAERCLKAARTYESLSETAQREKRGPAAEAHRSVAKRLRALSEQRSEMAKAAGIIVSKLKDMAADKFSDDAAGDWESKPRGIDAGEITGVKPEPGNVGTAKLGSTVRKSSKLEYVNGAYIDRKSMEWFGRREFTDDKRQQLADSGAARPDGSFPIENKADLNNAVQAFGRAKDKEGAKAHIKARAKALGATDALPDTWKSEVVVKAKKAADAKDNDGDDDSNGGADPDADDDDKSGKCADCDHSFGDAAKCAKCGCARKVDDGSSGSDADNDSDDSADGLKQNRGSRTKKEVDCDAVGENATESCEESLDEEYDGGDGSDDGSGDEADKRAKSKKEIRKSVAAVQMLGAILAGLEAAIDKGAAAKLGKSTRHQAKLADWLNAGGPLLTACIANSLTKLADGRDIEPALVKVTERAARLNETGVPAWADAVTGALRGSAMSKAVPEGERALRGHLAETISRTIQKSAKDRVQKQHDESVHFGALCDATKSAGDPNDSGSGKPNLETGSGKETKIGGDAGVRKERDDAVKALSRLTQQVVPLAKTIQDMRAKATDQEARLTKALEDYEVVQERLRRVEATPMPSIAKASHARPLTKEEDAGGDGKSDKPSDKLFDKIRAIPRGSARADEILRHAYKSD